MNRSESKSQLQVLAALFNVQHECRRLYWQAKAGSLIEG
jgi:hypothetical protein